MVRPISSSVGVSFAYGRRYQNGVIHKGVDFSDGREGHDVFSCLDGTVTHAGYGGWGPAYGQHVIIKSTFGGKTKWVLYGHLATENVRIGQTIKAGQKIGTNGGGAGHRYSGNSTGPHLHVQVGHANNYLAYEDPWAVINSGAPAVNKPPARPAAKPRAWFGVDMRNLAGFNDHGAATFDKRLGLIVEDIRTVGRDVVCVLELPNGKVDGCTKRMKAIGYVRAAGDLGRHIYVKQNVSTSGAKLFDLTPRLRGDTKQGVAVEVRPGKTPALIVTAQLENEDASGDTQVGQAKNLLKQALDYAAQRGIVKDRVFFAVDTNSDNRVRAEVFEAAGYFDVFDTAYSSENSAWRSFVGWVLKPTKGKRIDLLAAYKTRPVRRARLRLTTRNLSDHLDLFADLGTK